MTDPGKRSTFITIERATVESDDYGGETLTWAPLATAYAYVFHGTGTERREAAAETATQAATFELDWNPTVAGATPKDRLQAFGYLWDIHAVAIIGANREVHITATASTP